MYTKHPLIAKRWSDKTPKGVELPEKASHNSKKKKNKKTYRNILKAKVSRGRKY